jgi:NTP pyrophosphatase (non-canonical NTP hydrolase)
MKDIEKEILSITQEECSEVIQSVSKIFRFGIDTEWKGQSNREQLEEEIGDLKTMIDLLCQYNIVDRTKIDQHAVKKLEKLKKWSNISAE